MTIRFFDRQDESNPLNGSSYAVVKPLLDDLRRLSSRPPFFCEIEGENGFKLLVGVSEQWSCIQHSPMDGSPPYLMSVPREPQLGAPDMEFLIGNTPTPVHRRYILNVDLAEKVISSFVEANERSGLVEWEEI